MTDNDFDRTARLWLQDGPSQLADRVLEAALDEIHVTRQRRAWWPARRFTSMGNTIRLAAGVAAIVLVTVVGMTLLPGGGPGGPLTTPAPSPTPMPTPTPRPASFDSHAPGELEPGAYALEHLGPFRITFTVPAGWEKLSAPATIWAQPDSNARLGFMTVDNVFIDPCDPGRGLVDPPVGPTVDDLATALGSVVGLQATTPADFTLSGFTAKRIDLTVVTPMGPCVAETAFLRGNNSTLDVPAPGPQEDYRLWIVDVDGQRLVIIQVARAAATVSQRADLQAIFDSILLEATSPVASPSPEP